MSVLLLGSPSAAAGQETSVRAVETVDPSDGRRSLELMLPLTAPEVAAVQRRLAALGHRPGEPDGALDERTRRALAGFQREEGLPACGCVNVATVRRLDLDLRVLITRVAGDGGKADGARAVSDASAGVEVLYPSTTRPERPDPRPARGASEADESDGRAGPPPESRPRTGSWWAGGSVLPVPIPVFVGGEGPFPRGRNGVRLPATTGRARGLRPAPFGRVPFPGSRPSPSSGGDGHP